MAGSQASGKKLYQQIADVIASNISAGDFAPGDKLPAERELAERHSVSRATVREAMLALELRGLVESKRGSGVFVREAQADEQGASDLDIGAFELTEARILFESEAAALAAKLITPDEIAALETDLDNMVAENSRDESGEHADREFHLGIARATRNAAIVEVVRMLWDTRYSSPLCRHMLDKARKSGVKPRISEHRALLSALANGDSERARAAMKSHLERVIEGLLRVTETEAIERAKTEVAQKRDRFIKQKA